MKRTDKLLVYFFVLLAVVLFMALVGTPDWATSAVGAGGIIVLGYYLYQIYRDRA